ncbi:MAG: hypothetical protein CR988_07350 [Treponema sp.]|nr:MAG: hypothetical protein CR988_07350 [Treponema sp.]
MKKNIWVLVLLCLLFIGCSKSADYNSGGNMAKSEAGFDNYEEAEEVRSLDDDMGEPAVYVEKKLIKNAFLTFKTDDVKASAENINLAIKKHKGYVANESSEDRGGRVDVSITVRIPAKSFDAFIASISEGIKRFDRKEISTDDVTTHFVDMDARLRVKKEAEERYLQILKQARDVKDILEIENQIQMLRSDIESLEGQLRYLSNQVGYSTINIRYYYYGESSTNTGFLNDVLYALKKGARGFYNLLIGLITIWPVFIIAGVVFFGLRAFLKGRKINRKK